MHDHHVDDQHSCVLGVDAMAGYDVTKNVNLQLNIYNLADKFYLSSLNSGGSRYVAGTPRSFNLTANVKF